MPPSRQRSKASIAYRKSLNEHTQAGFCGRKLSCQNKREGHLYCQEHRDHKAATQKERRQARKHVATNTPKTFHNDLAATPEVPSPSEASPPTRLPHDPSAVWDKVIWVTSPDWYPFASTPTLAIQVYSQDRDTLGQDPWLVEAYSMELPNTVKRESATHYYIHQGLVTILAAGSLNTLSIDPHTWDWLGHQLDGSILSGACVDKDGRALRSVLFLHWTTQEPSKPTLEQVYNKVRRLRDLHQTSFRVYPNEDEALQEMGKLGDIRALDELARASRPAFAYRPKTCFGGGFPCQLLDCDTTVHKRTHSGSASHVHVIKEEVRTHKTYNYDEGGTSCHQLTCDPGTPTPEMPSQEVRGKRRAAKKKQPAKEQGHWFHQEYIPSLRHREFRVFIATEPSESGIRGRSGRVVTACMTAFGKDDVLAARSIQAGDLEPLLTRSDLEEFALYVFESLRARPDSMTFFESLEVGVRLDIGIADTGSGQSFFVNEITRWYGAHYFSYMICPEPRTQICKAFGFAFSAFLSGSV